MAGCSKQQDLSMSIVDDATPLFVEILEREADSLVTRRGEFLAVVLGSRPQLSGRTLGDEGAGSATPAT